MESQQHKRPLVMPPYGYLGLAILGMAELLLFSGNQFVAVWMTPISWTGYILFIDALIYKLKGESYIMSRRVEFAFMLPWSVLCWLVFELYNLHLHNWRYVGMTQDLGIRSLGFIWSFATIFPGILETAELIGILRPFDSIRIPPLKLGRAVRRTHFIFGAIFLGSPLLLPTRIAGLLFALVWVGFVLLLEPYNESRGGESLYPDLREGNPTKLLNLFAAGLVCGFLWEFWNYWAISKWQYTVPLSVGPKLFEMPLVGYLGFLPFAVEVYSMQNFLNVWRRAPRPDVGLSARLPDTS